MIKYQSNVGLSEYVSNMVAGKTVELAFTGSSITDAISDRCGDHSRGGAMAFPALGRQIIAIGVYGFGIVLGLVIWIGLINYNSTSSTFCSIIIVC